MSSLFIPDNPDVRTLPLTKNGAPDYTAGGAAVNHLVMNGNRVKYSDPQDGAGNQVWPTRADPTANQMRQNLYQFVKRHSFLQSMLDGPELGWQPGSQPQGDGSINPVTRYDYEVTGVAGYILTVKYTPGQYNDFLGATGWMGNYNPGIPLWQQEGQGRARASIQPNQRCVIWSSTGFYQYSLVADLGRDTDNGDGTRSREVYLVDTIPLPPSITALSIVVPAKIVHPYPVYPLFPEIGRAGVSIIVDTSIFKVVEPADWPSDPVRVALFGALSALIPQLGANYYFGLYASDNSQLSRVQIDGDAIDTGDFSFYFWHEMYPVETPNISGAFTTCINGIESTVSDQLIFFFTSGIESEAVSAITNINGGRTTIFPVGIDVTGQATLKQLAFRNGGVERFIQTDAALEQSITNVLGFTFNHPIKLHCAFALETPFPRWLPSFVQDFPANPMVLAIKEDADTGSWWYCDKMATLDYIELAAFGARCANTACRFFEEHTATWPSHTELALFDYGRGQYTKRFRDKVYFGIENWDGIRFLAGLRIDPVNASVTSWVIEFLSAGGRFKNRIDPPVQDEENSVPIAQLGFDQFVPIDLEEAFEENEAKVSSLTGRHFTDVNQFPSQGYEASSSRNTCNLKAVFPQQIEGLGEDSVQRVYVVEENTRNLPDDVGANFTLTDSKVKLVVYAQPQTLWNGPQFTGYLTVSRFLEKMGEGLQNNREKPDLAGKWVELWYYSGGVLETEFALDPLSIGYVEQGKMLDYPKYEPSDNGEYTPASPCNAVAPKNADTVFNPGYVSSEEPLISPTGTEKLGGRQHLLCPGDMATFADINGVVIGSCICTYAEAMAGGAVEGAGLLGAPGVPPSRIAGVGPTAGCRDKARFVLESDTGRKLAYWLENHPGANIKIQWAGHGAVFPPAAYRDGEFAHHLYGVDKEGIEGDIQVVESDPCTGNVFFYIPAFKPPDRPEIEGHLPYVMGNPALFVRFRGGVYNIAPSRPAEIGKKFNADLTKLVRDYWVGKGGVSFGRTVFVSQVPEDIGETLDPLFLPIYPACYAGSLSDISWETMQYGAVFPDGRVAEILTSWSYLGMGAMHTGVVPSGNPSMLQAFREAVNYVARGGQTYPWVGELPLIPCIAYMDQSKVIAFDPIKNMSENAIVEATMDVDISDGTYTSQDIYLEFCEKQPPPVVFGNINIQTSRYVYTQDAAIAEVSLVGVRIIDLPDDKLSIEILGQGSPGTLEKIDLGNGHTAFRGTLDCTEVMKAAIKDIPNFAPNVKFGFLIAGGNTIKAREGGASNIIDLAGTWIGAYEQDWTPKEGGGYRSNSLSLKYSEFRYEGASISNLHVKLNPAVLDDGPDMHIGSNGTDAQGHAKFAQKPGPLFNHGALTDMEIYVRGTLPIPMFVGGI